MKGNVINYLEEEFYIYEGCTNCRGIDGYEYSNMHKLIRYSILKLCGGVGIDTYNFCIDVLNAVDKDLSLQEVIQNNPWTATEFLACYFDKLNLIEHGSGIRGAWLSNIGKDIVNDAGNELLEYDKGHKLLKFCTFKESYNLCLDILKIYDDVDGTSGFEPVSELIVENIYIATELLITIFDELGLLDYSSNIDLTADGVYILKQGYETEEVY